MLGGYKMLGYHKVLNYPISMLAIVSPWWVPAIEEMSKYAALFLPICGCVLIGVQITLAVISHRKKS